MNIESLRHSLPTYAVKKQIIDYILTGKNQVTIISSATGSGKST